MILCKHLPIKTGFVAGKGSAPHRSITLKELDHRTGKAGPGGPAHPTPDGDGCSSDTLGRMLTPTLRARLASTARVAGDIRRKPHVAGNMPTREEARRRPVMPKWLLLRTLAAVKAGACVLQSPRWAHQGSNQPA